MQNLINTWILNNVYVPLATIMGIIYIWEKMQKGLHLKLPCETRVIWDTNNFFEKRDY